MLPWKCHSGIIMKLCADCMVGWLDGWMVSYFSDLSLYPIKIHLFLNFITQPPKAQFVLSLSSKSCSMSPLRQRSHKRGFIRNRIVFEAIMPSPDTS